MSASGPSGVEDAPLRATIKKNTMKTDAINNGSLIGNQASNRWERLILLIVLGYEAAGCLLGGSMLVIAPDGSLMGMPVALMHGVFDDFLLPGLILFGLGILNALAFITVLRRAVVAGIMATLATGGLLLWFWVEIAILQELHWLHAMWGLPVILGSMMIIALYLRRQEALRKMLLVCGIVASLLYAAINIIVALQWQEYRSASQTVSELSAVGAPTRNLWIVLSAPYSILMTAFGVGVWKSAVKHRFLHFTGGLLIAYGLLGFLWPFAPMHLRETLAAGGATSSDTMHIGLGVLTEFLYLLALGLAAVSLGKTFRLYSIMTFVMLGIFGTLTFLEAGDVGKNLPTPFIGIWERINIGIFLLWVIVLSLVLLPKENEITTLKH